MTELLREAGAAQMAYMLNIVLVLAAGFLNLGDFFCGVQHSETVHVIIPPKEQEVRLSVAAYQNGTAAGLDFLQHTVHVRLEFFL
jgi:hypothetical protein